MDLICLPCLPSRRTGPRYRAHCVRETGPLGPRRHCTRAGCSSATVPPACLARGTCCPVYFQGVAMKPGCLSGAGILLHNKLTGPRPARYTLIW
jgi:hypothetical protein